MDSLISKITISAGYGFRMAIVMQDIAQLDELYGRHTRITTVSGSQIKLFIQINDLETSEFVSEMLGETTQIYKTPIQRPGQGIFAPRVWAPHYTPRPLRSPLEVRQMSARLSILMVKNSPSFELTKIRHYLDKPYRALCEKAKGSPPVLPKLQPWQDEALGGAISPAAGEIAATGEEPSEKTRLTPRKTAARRTPAPKVRKARAERTQDKDATSTPPLVLAPHPAGSKPVRKTLALGDAPTPVGENCDLRDILASAEEGQDEAFDAMMGVIKSDQAEGGPLAEATKTLEGLHRSFGDEDK